MKKYSWIVALLLALSLVFFGCYVDDPEDGDDGDGDGDGDGGGTEYAKILELEPNAEMDWSTGSAVFVKWLGYQGEIEGIISPSTANFGNNNKFTSGQVYTFEYEFTAELHMADFPDEDSKGDVEEVLVVFVDGTPEADWYNELSTPVNIVKDSKKDIQKVNAGSFDITLTDTAEDALEDGGDGDPWWGNQTFENANKIVFKIENLAIRGDSKVVLNFTKFKVTKKS
ncbi:MAG: hypothetical protein LBH44_03535 [Treponema sp.]|jgi:hypothetical protein|nr:hypothetical protein [Treponema sp.]